MTFISVFGLLALAWRWRKGQVTRGEVLVLGIVGLSVLMVWAQIFVCDHKLFPERRYYSQALLLLFPWLVWGMRELCRRWRWPFARLTGAVVVGFALYDGVMLVKARLPVGRRAAYVAACNWAAQEIASDWKGPTREESVAFTPNQYISPARPIVAAFARRIPYLVGGRRLSRWRRQIDTADYWVGDLRRDVPPATGYEKMGEFTHGKYVFALYRRTK